MSARSSGAFSATAHVWDALAVCALLDEALERLDRIASASEESVRSAVLEIYPDIKRLRQSVDGGQGSYRATRYEIRDKALSILRWITDACINELSGEELEATTRKVFGVKPKPIAVCGFDLDAAEVGESSITQNDLFEMSA